MEYEDKWYEIDMLGEGGQGRVYHVLDSSKLKIETKILPEFRDLLNELTSEKDLDSIKKRFPRLRWLISALISMDDPKNHGALKILHEPKDARDSERADARIKREIKAMSEVQHANLIRILDHDDGKWFVSKYYPRGSLLSNKNIFTGDLGGALRAFRPLVEGVSLLHKNGWVHRDIKPENVFLDIDGNLVLGDFGLVIFTDELHTRISAAFENVGSRDWMPGWAQGIKIEDVKFTFDVFSLGKLLWAMVSDKPILRLWYFYKDEFNLESMFPDAPHINLANRLFEKCIVEEEADCLPDAVELLKEVDQLLAIINKNADLINDDGIRPCKVCGIGSYELAKSENNRIEYIFGTTPPGSNFYKIFTCSHCGNVQFFFFRDGTTPNAWSKIKSVK